jgi:protein-L-isoaspartate(D-aspartate) O-methyltransferase
MDGESTPETLMASLRQQVDDERVLAAIAAVPRDVFAGPANAARAWDDAALPIAGGQAISQPLVVAHMCALLDVRPGDRVLDVGTGTGYHAAVLAALGGRVWSIERDPALSRLAARQLAEAGVEGVELVVGDGSLGLPAHAPFDAINVAAAAERRVPPALEEQLARGGRLVVPVDQMLVVVDRDGRGRLRRGRAGSVRFVPLVGEG